MRFQTMLAVYALFWVMSAFALLPFGVRTHEEAGAERVPGQADSAPHRFRPRVVVLRATVVSAFLFGLWYLNWTQGWFTRDSLDFLKPPELR